MIFDGPVVAGLSGKLAMARVLIIDDDPAALRMMNRMLSEAGHEVVEAVDGVDGIRKFQSEKPDIVVTDVIMPQQEGIQTILNMRATGIKVGIIAISGGGIGKADTYLGIAEDMGADATLEKPFRAQDLLSLVEFVLRRTT